MAPTAIRERRRTLRYRNPLVRQVVQIRQKARERRNVDVDKFKTKATVARPHLS
jgi:hypothetical protein